ncbi:MAG: alpha/beta hydrolase family protein [Terriglobales bacterium]
MKIGRRAFAACLFTTLLLTAACKREAHDRPDRPRLSSNVTMRDVTFRSVALGRSMPYRVILPTHIPAGSALPVVYMLHGGGGEFRNWSNYTGVAEFAEHGLILVMPEADESYYTNSADRPLDRYEDYVVKDLIADVQSRFPAATGRANRAIIGVSMGGFGAVKLALQHPDLFGFAGGISSALDVPTRPFSIRRYSQWRHHRSIFGPWKGQIQQANDPFVLARAADPARTPYMFLTCGDKEGLLPTNRSFAALLDSRHFRFEFHVVPGGHNWTQWEERLPGVFNSLLAHLGRTEN